MCGRYSVTVESVRRVRICLAKHLWQMDGRRMFEDEPDELFRLDARR